ncbi:unnamed protein product [Notodromas monacha]|uniref:Uncharacterized protein n=1 Tax=Notodromas monacha TaxID=399045 RepID=A0A7R9GGF9_9CRUS|nr:unnamed protein product [Notodromas monacha]CAG0920153.1 unnamed protein product [Notodromas monacha]
MSGLRFSFSRLGRKGCSAGYVNVPGRTPPSLAVVDELTASRGRDGENVLIYAKMGLKKTGHVDCRAEILRANDSDVLTRQVQDVADRAPSSGSAGFDTPVPDDECKQSMDEPNKLPDIKGTGVAPKKVTISCPVKKEKRKNSAMTFSSAVRKGFILGVFVGFFVIVASNSE